MNQSTDLNSKKYIFKRGRKKQSLSRNTVYAMGFIGASVYYISAATSFWIGVLGILKAVVWPAFLVYGLLQYINI